MVSNLVCALLLLCPAQGTSDRQNLLARLVPRPTGANGYEEYIKAAEIASDQICSTYDSWSPDADISDVANTSQAKLQLIRRLNGMTVLDVRKEEIRRFGEALEQVRQGNLKKIVDPRPELTPDSIFPEVTYFRRIARMFAADAYTKFADGNSTAATKSLVDGLTFSYNISGNTMISTLVGVASFSILLAECSDRLSNLSLSDCQTLDRIANQILQAPNPLASSFEGERKMQIVMADWFFGKEPKDMQTFFGDDAKVIDGFKDRLAKATDAQRKIWKQSAISLINDFYASTQRRISGPESGWVGADEDIRAWVSQEPDPVVKSFVTTLFPVFDQACSATARSRTQLRLLSLQAKILSFHWLQNRFPQNLQELGKDVSIKDPLSGESFVYEPRGGAYRLYSKGTKMTGEIELRYRRPVSADDEKKNP